ncbi:transporter substrate-binding domain-containing protein [Gallaecimonas sp. GXIMD4217]|uniref:substrate-binding periplasmic protein n=1 Tax=Gallaecimonas sp. GXIMD4217 TaxID=3131927 RepID=UPI00311B323A
MKALLWLLMLCSALARGQDIVIWNQLAEHPNPAIVRLLRLALDNTSAEYGDYRIRLSEPMEQGRVVHELISGAKVQVGVFAPDPQRVKELLAVPVPVAKGLLGWRLCFIREHDQKRFDGIRSLADWRARGLTLGQHLHWPDTAILQANDLKVLTITRYQSLFLMLQVGRFDCFPRSALEIQDEARRHPELAIEKQLVLRYPLTLLYFVSPQYPELAERIEKGLQMARASGDFDRLFDRYFGPAATELNLKNRAVLELESPNLTELEQDMLKDPSLWYRPRQ